MTSSVIIEITVFSIMLKFVNLSTDIGYLLPETESEDR